MKLQSTIIGLGSLIVAIHGARLNTYSDRVGADSVKPNSYIVVYKSNADTSQVESHEAQIHSKAKKNGRKGISKTYDGRGLKGYVVDISRDDLNDVLDSSLVRPSQRSIEESPLLIF
jgi:hypothetical protein